MSYIVEKRTLVEGFCVVIKGPLFGICLDFCQTIAVFLMCGKMRLSVPFCGGASQF